MRILLTVVVLLAAWPSLAGDFCVVVCNDAAHRPERTCPSPTFRTSAEIEEDFKLIARGGAPSWPFGALGNGMFQFCSSAERKQLIDTVLAVLPDATADRRRQLADFVCMIGSKKQCEKARVSQRRKRRS
ncbi:MAG TPA: hypothetical protein VFP80_00305 [Thermoanaerobaculia bacterium]|nr:hypothetical protein [Thermoanaerobaculia bacterium]